MSIRVNVLQEGVRQQNDYIFQKGSLWNKDNNLPVYIAGLEMKEIGRAQGFLRDEETGWLSWDITLRVDFLETLSPKDVLEMYDFHIEAMDLRATVKLITYGVVTAILIVPKPAFPKEIAL